MSPSLLPPEREVRSFRGPGVMPYLGRPGGGIYQAYVGAGGAGRLTRRADRTVLVAESRHIGRLGCER